MNKKARFKLWEDWPEFGALVLLIIGFLLAVLTRHEGILYIVIFLFGGVFGRFWYKFSKRFKAPAAIIILGFLLGYVLGSFYGDRKLVILLFLFGMTASYYAHKKKIILSTEY